MHDHFLPEVSWASVDFLWFPAKLGQSFRKRRCSNWVPRPRTASKDNIACIDNVSTENFPLLLFAPYVCILIFRLIWIITSCFPLFYKCLIFYYLVAPFYQFFLLLCSSFLPIYFLFLLFSSFLFMYLSCQFLFISFFQFLSFFFLPFSH